MIADELPCDVAFSLFLAQLTVDRARLDFNLKSEAERRFLRAALARRSEFERWEMVA